MPHGSVGYGDVYASERKELAVELVKERSVRCSYPIQMCAVLVDAINVCTKIWSRKSWDESFR